MHADCDEDGEATQVGTETGEEREDAQEEGDGSEEERDEVEDPGESAHVEVVASVVDERVRHASRGSEVPHWVEWESWSRRGAVGVEAIVDAADVEVCPSCWVPQL